MATEEPTQKGPKKACAYFLRCGSCSFGDSCRFHHPFERLPEFKFNSRGLPLRAGEPDESLQLPRQYMWGNPPVQRTFSGNAINNRSSSHLRPMSSMQSSSDGADSDSAIPSHSKQLNAMRVP
ncbi:hypothetical protein WJX72_008828 [[Myrmecia] bisecta]|uniref:C3H1-type domain-containing protein n=1 Tax=[Myrmecia] bisecta TaxID=41462 RepID=A0AAW1QFX7_9CHLO